MKSSLLQSLFDEQERRPLSVSELNEQVKNALEKKSGAPKKKTAA